MSLSLQSQITAITITKHPESSQYLSKILIFLKYVLFSSPKFNTIKLYSLFLPAHVHKAVYAKLVQISDRILVPDFIRLAEAAVIQRQRAHPLLQALAQTAENVHAGMDWLGPRRPPLMANQGLYISSPSLSPNKPASCVRASVYQATVCSSTPFCSNSERQSFSTYHQFTSGRAGCVSLLSSSRRAA